MAQLFERVVNIFGCGPCLTAYSIEVARCPLDSPTDTAVNTPLMKAPDKCSMQFQTEGSSPPPDENFFRQPSWNTNVKSMREASPFYQVQTRSRGAIGGELRPAANSLLLSQYHHDRQGANLPPFPGAVVRRPVSPTGSS